MRRILLFVLIALMLQVVGCDNKHLSKENAIDIAYNSLNEQYKSDVINKDTPKLDESEYSYKITFDAKNDAILGPIIVTVDKKTFTTKISLRD